MRVERLKSQELKDHCKSLGIDIKGKKRNELIDAVYELDRKEIDEARSAGTCLQLLEQKISKLADEYHHNLTTKIALRKVEMEKDDQSHYLIYRVLGIPNDEGMLIDVYQNTGRFLYKYAGSFLEEAATICLFFSNSKGKKTLVENTEGSRPKTFEIDFLNEKDAIEIKWRDATTDGDHITKEHTRIKAIDKAGYRPVRVMFYYPQREQAIKIQKTLETLYKGISGEYYAGDSAWDYIKEKSGYDLKAILTKIADRRFGEENK